MTRRFEMREIAAPKSAQVSGTQVPYFGGIPQNGEVVDRAVGAVLDTAERVARLHDLGVQQRATQERNRLRGEMDLELQKAAAVQMGSDESLWRKDGSLNQDKYDGIVAKYREMNNAVQPGDFWLGENSARYEGEQKLEHDDIGLRAAKFVGLKTIENTRKAFADNYELAMERGEYDEARRLVGDARGALLSDTEAEIELAKIGRKEHEGLQNRLYDGAVGMAMSNPQAVMLGLARGEYDEVDAVRRERLYNMARQASAARAMQEDFTEKEKAEIVRGQIVKPRFKVRNGATEKEWKWREYYNREGTYDKFAGEIRSEFDAEVMNCPVPESQDEADLWVNYMVKKWTDPQTGYGLEEYSVRVRCQQAVQNWLGEVNEGKSQRFSTDSFLESLSDAQVAPWAEGQVRYRKEAFADDAALNEEAAVLLSERRGRILHDVRNAMARWEAGNPDASYSQAYEKCMGYLLKFSAMHDEAMEYDVDWRVDGDDEKFEESAREGVKWQRQNIERDSGAGVVFQKARDASGIMAQQEAYRGYMETQKAAVMPERSKAEQERLYGIRLARADEEVLFVTQAEYDALSRKFGENPVAHVTLPGSKAYLPVPVRVGDVDGFSLSDAAAVRLNNTRAKRAIIRFAKGDEPGKEKENKEEVPEELPPGEPDDGLVPEDGVAYEDGYVPEDRNFLFPDENGN